MSSARPTGHLRRNGAKSVEDSADALARLRRVIVGPEAERIDHLEHDVRLSPEKVGDVLPEAVACAHGARPETLALALEPSVVSAFRSFASRQPDVLADALAPTIGGAVRRAVAEAIAAMLQRLNETLEKSLSIESVKWRIEAARTGRPFAEIVLLRTLKYRVEQVSLIHAKTSLVLEHVEDPAVPPQAPDQVAAMLAAIDAFGREAFGPFATPQHLDKFDFGELSVWVTHDEWITVAAVVRGTAPADFIRPLREARERIRLEYQADLERFDGDARPFAATRPTLLPLLRTERRKDAHRAESVILIVVALGVVAIAFGVARTIMRHRADRRTEAAYARALSSEPGIVLTSSRWENGRGRFVGLSDPLSPSPTEILTRHGLAPLPADALEFAPFLSLDPRLREQRTFDMLRPPEGVNVTLDGATVHAAGVAPRAWMDEARVLARAVPGVTGYDDTELRSEESIAAFHLAESALEANVVTFERGSSRVAPKYEADLRSAEEAVALALQRAAEAREAACVDVVAHTDQTGTEVENRSVGEARAATVTDALAKAGVSTALLRPRVAAVSESMDRRTIVRFHLSTDCGGHP